MPQFKRWIEDGDTSRPFAGQRLEMSTDAADPLLTAGLDLWRKVMPDEWKDVLDGDVSLSTDAQGHEHADKGPGGGQFVKGGASKATQALHAETKATVGAAKSRKDISTAAKTVAAKVKTAIKPHIDAAIASVLSEPWAASGAVRRAIKTHTRNLAADIADDFRDHAKRVHDAAATDHYSREDVLSRVEKDDPAAWDSRLDDFEGEVADTLADDYAEKLSHKLAFLDDAPDVSAAQRMMKEKLGVEIDPEGAKTPENFAYRAYVQWALPQAKAKAAAVSKQARAAMEEAIHGEKGEAA